jgi:hypothetical protein
MSESAQSTLRTFCSTIDEWFQGVLRIIPVHHIDECRIHPSASLNGIEPTDYNLKLEIELLVLVLNGAVMTKSIRLASGAYAVTFTPTTRFITKHAAVVALGCPTSLALTM